ncbi:Phosphomethylpyrimidine kinase [Pseudothermotoga thermarum DSM 5069]|uniref:Phosphomethylpyrimidine kinase n=1 Tax=Pseudothermotoga thermarum DSM 5069 TaxID=688269 RepID=F7YUG3_9THEM|nr:Phosphomethylpyrimidine kinase [Pseudothermotoga thermarum DSM 5069]
MVLVVAGFDPSAGAGILQDIKTLSLLGVQTCAVVAVETVQNAEKVFQIKPRPVEDICLELDVLPTPRVVKVGLCQPTFVELLRRKYPNAKIVWNVILKSSSGFEFFKPQEVLPYLGFADYLLMNSEEYDRLVECNKSFLKNMMEKIIITGGHRKEEKIIIEYNGEKFVEEKVEGKFHGTGCCFSSAFAGFLDLGYEPKEAIIAAAALVRKILERSKNLKYVASELLAREWQKYDILEQLDELLEEFLMLGPLTVPEVGQNVSFALDWSKTEEEVAKFPGRIRMCLGKAVVVSKACFKDKSHTARMVLTAKKFFPHIKCATNIKFKKEYVENAIKQGYLVFKYDRSLESEELMKKDEGSMEFMIKLAVEKLGRMPDVIWDDGWYGKEAMIRVFGRNPKEILEKVKKIVSG